MRHLNSNGVGVKGRGAGRNIKELVSRRTKERPRKEIAIEKKNGSLN